MDFLECRVFIFSIFRFCGVEKERIENDGGGSSNRVNCKSLLIGALQHSVFETPSLLRSQSRRSGIAITFASFSYQISAFSVIANVEYLDTTLFSPHFLPPELGILSPQRPREVRFLVAPKSRGCGTKAETM